jgi:hypothetical protein
VVWQPIIGGLSVEVTLGDGGQQGLVVVLGMVGVAAGESAHGPVDVIAAVELARPLGAVGSGLIGR